jgi:hypothetical protein
MFTDFKDMLNFVTRLDAAGYFFSRKGFVWLFGKKLQDLALNSNDLAGSLLAGLNSWLVTSIDIDE